MAESPPSPDDRSRRARRAGSGGPGPDSAHTAGQQDGFAVEYLATATCWQLLAQTSLGRLALVRADGTPDIFPVHYLAHEGALYIRTAGDSELLHIAHHPFVAVEIDGEAEDARWSVVVRGPIERVASDTELRDSGVRGLPSWGATHRVFAVKVTASSIAGRVFAAAGGPSGRARAFPASSAMPSPPPHPEAPRATRPIPIPHRTPPPSDTGATPVVPPREPGPAPGPPRE